MQLSRKWTNPTGSLGWVAAAGMAAGVVWWWPIALAAGGGWCALAMMGHNRLGRAMLHLQAAFPEGVIVGKRNELRTTIAKRSVLIRNNVDTLHVLIGTELPSFTICRRSGSRRSGLLGDPAFDAEFYIEADDPEGDLGWRLLLTHDARARFRALYSGMNVELHNGWLDFVIHADDADGEAIEKLVRDSIAFVNALPGDPEIETFFEQVQREPVANVRMNHYGWLVARGYEVPAVLHVASRDVSQEIREWAQSQRMSETLYR